MKEDIKIKLHIDTERYYSKPIQETGIISKRIIKKVSEVTGKELASKIEKGYTVLPYVMKGSRSKNNFKECQAIFLDFDNTVKKGNIKVKSDNYVSFKEMYKDTFIQKYANFMYETYSSTDSINRFRVVFILDNKITDLNSLKNLLQFFIDKYPNVDIQSTKDVSRLYYSSNKQVVEVNYTNVLPIHEILGDRYLISLKKPIKKPLDLGYNSTEIVDKIRNREIEYLKEYYKDRINIQKVYVSKYHFIQNINSIDLSVLLGLDNPNLFKCVLTLDNNPSASIIKHYKYNMYIYKRFSDSGGFELNVVEVFKILLNTQHTSNVLNFFKELFGIRYEIPENLKKTYNLVFEIKEIFKNIEKIKPIYPNLYKVLKPHNQRIARLLDYYLNNYQHDITMDFNNGLNIVNSISKVSYILYGESNSKAVEKSYKILNLLTYIKLTKKLRFEEYPDEIKHYILTKKEQNKKTVNVIQLFYNNESTDSVLKLIEQQCKHLKDNGYTFKGFSQDFITVLDSVSEANRVYTQTENKTVSNSLQRLIEDVDNEFHYQFNECSKKYIIESELKTILKQKYQHSNNNLAVNYKKALHLNLLKHSKQNKKVSKKIQEDFNLDTDKYYNIIF